MKTNKKATNAKVLTLGASKQAGQFSAITGSLTLITQSFTINYDIISHLNPIYMHYLLLLYRQECFTGKHTTRKIHNNYIRDPSGLFCIISHVILSMT